MGYIHDRASPSWQAGSPRWREENGYVHAHADEIRLSDRKHGSTASRGSIASAEAKNNVGWAWAGCPSCYNAYTPKKAYSYNSAGGAIKIVPRATGVYWVEFDSLYDGAPDNAQVTAYLTNGYCEAGNWGPHTPKSKQVLVTVWCWDANGNSANQIFSVLYQSRSAPLGDATKGIAFVLADPYRTQPTRPPTSTTPPA